MLSWSTKVGECYQQSPLVDISKTQWSKADSTNHKVSWLLKSMSIKTPYHVCRSWLIDSSSRAATMALYDFSTLRRCKRTSLQTPSESWTWDNLVMQQLSGYLALLHLKKHKVLSLEQAKAPSTFIASKMFATLETRCLVFLKLTWPALWLLFKNTK